MRMDQTFFDTLEEMKKIAGEARVPSSETSHVEGYDNFFDTWTGEGVMARFVLGIGENSFTKEKVGMRFNNTKKPSGFVQVKQ